MIVFGGYGVFGSLVSRELARRGRTLTVAGRDGARAEAFARALGPGHRGAAVDVTNAARVRPLLAGHRVAVHCAGPFAGDAATLLDACLDAGCHYVDIADDRGYARRVRVRDARARERGLVAAYGCSSLPGLSGALARRAAAGAAAVERVRVTLFIGHDNPKSEAAIRSVVGGLGRPIEAPQGRLHGFREHERVALPAPFGSRLAYAFDSPDYDLLPALLGTRSVVVLVGFERAAAGLGFSALARLGPWWGDRTVRAAARLGRLWPGGVSGGVVQVDLLAADGGVRSAAAHAATDGQRLAILPAVLAAIALEDGLDARGVRTAYELLGHDALLAGVEAGGFQLGPP